MSKPKFALGQHGKGREAGDKSTGSGRAGYRRREVLTPCAPTTQNKLHQIMHLLLPILVHVMK